jgi:uncharacterized protein YyaL (SSP411 family)
MPNRLAGETSPYLLQHATNPVEWHPWDETAFSLARASGKPILLSVGYSACHWCHVMAHESFEDPGVAALMNDLFVNIKVDREERPDLDQIYQTAHALLTQRSGGWPLTMFLTPAGEPFFGGTYFPKDSRFGLPGFRDLLPRIAAAYRERGAEISEQNARLIDALASLEPGAGAAHALPADAPAAALAELKERFDPEWGGFGAAPKFPHTAELELCLRESVRANDADALAVVEVTLARMADGGIHDQLGGGFSRYSVDEFWAIPHFEKMLYDNGPLLALYSDLARRSGLRRHADVAHGIVGWMEREMRAPDGAFHSSLDADSEHEEGKFYVWSRDEIRALVGESDYALVAPHWGLDRAPNFEGHAWHLVIARQQADVAAQQGLTEDDARERIARARATLFAERAKRIAPGRDDKILTSWNALAIAGLARAARALDQPSFAELALAAADALHSTAWRDGRLLATRKDGKAQLNAYLDDHAFLLAALIELMQTRFRAADFAWARSLADLLLAQFEDRERGGFWFTSHDHERLIHRTKPGHDNATPSGNAVAARALIALGHLAAEPRYVEAGERAVRLFAPALSRSPSGFATMIGALEEAIAPPTAVILDGDRATCKDWQRTLERTLRPAVRILDVSDTADLPPALAKGPRPTQGAVAWICAGASCLPPVTDLAATERLLDGR